MTSVIEYRDPVEGFAGWLVYDATDCRMAAGGCRVQSGLKLSTLATLASRMTMKERLLGINVDGGKCGIDYDPWSPGRPAALRRFLGFLREELHTRFSMGCDMGTRFDELEQLARAEGVPSIKYVIRNAQGISDEEFFARMGALDEPVGALTLSERRAGHALAQSAVAAARSAGLHGPVTCALQGFGNLGRAAACSLLEAGVRIVAVADEHGCASDPRGLDVERMLACPHGAPVPSIAGPVVTGPPTDLFGVPADLLVLAAGEDAMTSEQAAALASPVVVVGANCGLAVDVEGQLYDRGVLVVPDVIGGIGGSASMEALFGPAVRPSPREVLDGVTEMMRHLVDAVVDISRRQGVSPRAATLELAAAAAVHPDERPYGCSPYLSSSPHLSSSAVAAGASGGMR